MTHFIYTPFTGLGLYNGFRGNKWLDNRIKIYKQFVIPSLKAQTNQNFTLWLSWRKEEESNKRVKALKSYLIEEFGQERVVFTYSGVCFWDDKYEDEIAHKRLISSLHHAIGNLLDYTTSDTVLMTINASDDCYHSGMVEEMQTLFKKTDYQAAGYTKGYIMSYQTKEVREYNPETNPPFFTIKFPKEIFIDPLKHAQYTGPYKSHEYVPDYLKYLQIPKRGFLVGTHGENISTHFNIPYAGEQFRGDINGTGFHWLSIVEPLKIRYSIRKILMRKLPHRVQRKLRYWFGELLLNKLYVK